MNLKKHIVTILASGLLSCSIAQKLPAASPTASTTQTVGISEVSITYSRPSVKGRKIWGGLVSYGYSHPRFSIDPDVGVLPATAPWRTGANMAPTLTLSHDASIEDNTVKAGTYVLFIAVFENDEADIILSSNSSQIGSMVYDEKDNVLVARVKTESAPYREQMIFTFDSVTTDYTVASLNWENLKIPFSITFDTQEIAYQTFLEQEDTMQPMLNGNWYATAAVYLMNNQFHLDKALRYIKNSVDGYQLRSFPNLTTYANLLLLQNGEAEAQVLLDEAFADPNAVGLNTLLFYGNQTLTLKLPDAALRTYSAIVEYYPGNEWRVLNGQARAYAQKKEFKKAETALKSAKTFAPKGYDMSILQRKLDLIKQKKSLE
ncbi:MAG: DUF2911 domain-containing protein [Cyclobacteriaceae bacterium]